MKTWLSDSIIAIQHQFKNRDTFYFAELSVEDIETDIQNLNRKEACQYSGIPRKFWYIYWLFVKNHKQYNNIIIYIFISLIILKMLILHLSIKRGRKTSKGNYRLVNILPVLSKLFEKSLFNSKRAGVVNLNLTPCGFSEICFLERGWSADFWWLSILSSVIFLLKISLKFVMSFLFAES